MHVAGLPIPGIFLKSLVEELKEKRQILIYFKLQSSLSGHIQSAMLILLEISVQIQQVGSLTLLQAQNTKNTFIPWDTKMALTSLIFVAETSLRYHSTQN